MAGRSKRTYTKQEDLVSAVQVLLQHVDLDGGKLKVRDAEEAAEAVQQVRRALTVMHQDVLQDDGLEQRLLGAVLADPDTMLAARQFVLADDFYDSRHMILYGVMLELLDQKVRPSLSNVIDYCVQHQILRQVGGADYLKRLPLLLRGLGPQATVDAPVWAEAVLDLSERRALRVICQKNQALAEDLSHDRDEMWREVTNVVLEGKRRSLQQYRPIGSVAGELRELLAGWFKGEHPDAIPTGIRTLDYRIVGLGRRQLIILAGRPGSGKTMLAEIIMDHVERAGYVVMFSSLEMSMTELGVREVCRMASVNSLKLRRGELRDDENAQMRVWQALEAFERRTRTLVNDETLQYMKDIHYEATVVALQHGLDLHVLDYAELAQNEVSDESTRLQVVTTNRREKALAKSANCATLMLSQVGRDSVLRPPMESDLMYGGEAEADGVLGLFWPWNVLQSNPSAKIGVEYDTDPNSLYVNISKFRHGKKGRILLYIDAERQLITDHPSQEQNTPFIGRSGNVQQF